MKIPLHQNFSHQPFPVLDFLDSFQVPSCRVLLVVYDSGFNSCHTPYTIFVLTDLTLFTTCSYDPLHSPFIIIPSCTSQMIQ